MKMNIIGLSDPGKVKHNNEDHFTIIYPEFPSSPHIFAVSDGVGGRRAGELASVKSLQVICNFLLSKYLTPQSIENYLMEAFKIANSDLRKTGEGHKELEGMGTTAVVAVIFDDMAFVCSVGDSRAYAIGKNGIKQITVDHSWTNELIKQGLINGKQAKSHPYRHHLTRALGIDDLINPDIYKVEFNDFGWILLCTDGLTEHISESEIQNIILKLTDAQTITKKLVQMALSRGGHDNITIVLGQINPPLV